MTHLSPLSRPTAPPLAAEPDTRLNADVALRIELRRLAAEAARRESGALAAILDVAVATLDQMIGTRAGRPRPESPSPRPDQSCRNFRVDGRRTSLKLEAEFWQVLDRLMEETGIDLDTLCAQAHRLHPGRSLASAMRVLALDYADGGRDICSGG
jgi:predicted DNA-binding ribbon-helix-helix protein